MSHDVNNPVREQHDRQWDDRLQDAIDGTLSVPDRSQLEAHLADCVACRTRHGELRKLHGLLQTALPPTAPIQGFDTRVLKRIAATQHDSRANLRQLELREHQARLQRLAKWWRGYWRFNLGNALGIVTLAATASTFMFGGSPDLHSWTHPFHELHVPTFMLLAGGVTALVMSLTHWADKSRAADR